VETLETVAVLDDGSALMSTHAGRYLLHVPDQVGGKGLAAMYRADAVPDRVSGMGAAAAVQGGSGGDSAGVHYGQTVRSGGGSAGQGGSGGDSAGVHHGQTVRAGGGSGGQGGSGGDSAGVHYGQTVRAGGGRGGGASSATELERARDSDGDEDSSTAHVHVTPEWIPMGLYAARLFALRAAASGTAATIPAGAVGAVGEVTASEEGCGHRGEGDGTANALSTQATATVTPPTYLSSYGGDGVRRCAVAAALWAVESADVVEEATSEGVAKFTAFADRRVRANYCDRTILELSRDGSAVGNAPNPKP